MPKQYRLIPLSVEAIQLTPESVERASIWCGGREVEEIDPIDRSKKFVALNIPTISGVKRAHDGDYIVKNPMGDFTTMSKRDFEAKYELVDPA